MSQQVYERRYTCRACMESDLRPVLDLGNQPLTHVVDPDVLYGPDYPYRSGQSQGWAFHCDALAAEAGFPDARVLDIGCLDGVLLGAFLRWQCQVSGCDPSAPPGTDDVLREFFTATTRHPDAPFDIITATNVFGHVDDARGFLEGVAANLAPDGIAVIEAPWIVDMVDKGAWDTIYHEHLSYWGLKPMARVAGRAGLTITRVQHFPDLHGGTMRYYLGHKETPVQAINPDMCRAWMAEDDLGDESWDEFQNESYNAIQTWTRYFADTVHKKQVMAYGAAAKFNTLLNSMESRPNLLAIFDETPSKIGKFSPGWRIPILEPTARALSQCDEIVVGASNWKSEIEKKVRALGFLGPVVAPW
jgi:SAM-dependent methyltransferase